MIETALLASQPVPVERATHPLWRARVQTASGGKPVSAYLKQVPQAGLWAELICAAVGKAAGLPVPNAYAVLDREGETGTPGAVLFGSQDIPWPAVSAHYTNHDSARENVMAWDKIHDTAVFDEWIANADRHPGNLLIDGRGGYWLIDHAFAFGGLGWITGEINADLATANQLADLLIRHGKDIQVQRLRHKASACAAEWAGVATPAGGQPLQRALSFLHHRQPLLRALMDLRCGQPSLL